MHDKLLLVLSENSVVSPWVEREVQAAFEKGTQKQEAGAVSHPSGRGRDGGDEGVGGRHPADAAYRRVWQLERPRVL